MAARIAGKFVKLVHQGTSIFVIYEKRDGSMEAACVEEQIKICFEAFKEHDRRHTDLLRKLRQAGEDEWAKRVAWTEALQEERELSNNFFDQIKMWRDIQARALAKPSVEHYADLGIGDYFTQHDHKSSAMVSQVGTRETEIHSRRGRKPKKGALVNWLRKVCPNDPRIRLHDTVPGHIIDELCIKLQHDIQYPNSPGLKATIGATLCRLGYSKERGKT
jgi:hypothetical protein